MTKKGATGSAFSRKLEAKIDGSFRPHSKRDPIAPGIRPGKMYNGKKALIIEQTEYVMDISSSLPWQSVFFDVNPGNDTLFPVLSQLAANYDCWYPIEVSVEYRPTCIDLIASSTENVSEGLVMMCFHKDAIRGNFQNKFEFLNYEASCDSKPSQNMILGLDTSITREYYTRIGTTISEDQSAWKDIGPIFGTPGGTPVVTVGTYSGTSSVSKFMDPRLYDPARLQIAWVNMQKTTAQTVGEIYITYKIALCDQKASSALGSSIKTAHYRLNNSVTSTNIFGTSNVVMPYSNMSLAFGATSLFLEPSISSGNYLIMYNLNGTSGSSTFPTITAGRNTKLLQLESTSSTTFGMTGAYTTAKLLECVVVQVTGNDASINFASLTTPVAPLSGDLIVTQVNGYMTQGQG